MLYEEDFWGLLASFIAVFGTACSLSPWDVWTSLSSAPTPEPLGCDAGCLTAVLNGRKSIIKIRTPPNWDSTDFYRFLGLFAPACGSVRQYYLSLRAGRMGARRDIGWAIYFSLGIS